MVHPAGDNGAVGYLTKVPSLKRLFLWDTKIGEDALASIGQLPALEVVYLDRTAITDAGLASLSGLPALRTLLVETRQRGYAVENGEVTPGFASVAAAVLDHNGHPVAGLAVTFPAAEVDGTAHLSDAVRRAAGALGQRLGGR